jgi:hypothetical protein
VAEVWASSDELTGVVTAEELSDFLKLLSQFARTAVEDSARLYCWWVL